MIVIDGLVDYIIVDKDDVLLIYPKSKEQDIKKIVSKLSWLKFNKYLLVWEENFYSFW